MKEALMMNSAKTNEGKPKLYIIQPSFKKPSRDMQTIYHSSNEPDPKVTDEKEKEQSEGGDSFNRKQFNDMTIEEKVIYFSTLPFQAPKVKSQIITNKRTFIGIIQDY